MRAHEDRSSVGHLRGVHPAGGCCRPYRDVYAASRPACNDNPLRRFHFSWRDIVLISMKVPYKPIREAAWIL
jgi:hypothetical protein